MIGAKPAMFDVAKTRKRHTGNRTPYVRSAFSAVPSGSAFTMYTPARQGRVYAVVPIPVIKSAQVVPVRNSTWLSAGVGDDRALVFVSIPMAGPCL